MTWPPPARRTPGSSRCDDSAAARVRISHLAFIQGKTAEAVKQSRAALAAAKAESAVGSGLAWYEYQLGDTLIGTGDRKGAAAAYAAAVKADPRFHLAHWGLGRVAAADGRLDDAIAEVSTAIAIVPLPEFLARRADLYRMRAASGDARREADDRKTVLAIARLAGTNANVYDRTLALYLAGSGDDPGRALELAQAEIAGRKDVYGYDALAWALLANHRPAEADTAMTTALAFGTHDAKLLYHAGMIAAARRRRDPRPDARCTDALALDASFDPLAATLAREQLARAPMTGILRGRRVAVGVLVAVAAMLVVPAIAAAHPLGNFTINHYAGIRVEPDRIRLDVVIDQAEIPTFQARLGFDTDGDGEVSDDEANAGRETSLHAARDPTSA